MSARAAVTLMLPVAEAPPGNHSQQIVEQHEEEDRPEVRQEAIGPVAADRRPGHVVADEKQHRLEHVHEPAAATWCGDVPDHREPGPTIISTAAISSMTMNRVICKPEDRGQIDLPARTWAGSTTGSSSVSWSSTWSSGFSRVSSHGMSAHDL